MVIRADTSGTSAWSAVVRHQWATLSISQENAGPPGAERRLRATTAAQMESPVATNSASTYEGSAQDTWENLI